MVVTTVPPIHKNGTYEVKVVRDPDDKYNCYGVTNRMTGVIEAYVTQLARAIHYADQFEADLKGGYKSEFDNMDSMVAALLEKKKKPAGGGSLQ